MGPGPDRLAAAQQALADLGVTVADLQHHNTFPTPTFGEYLPIVVAAAGSGASRTYGTYWARMATAWADRRLNEVHASDIEAMKYTPTDATPANTSSPQPAPSTTAPSPTDSSTRITSDDPPAPTELP